MTNKHRLLTNRPLFPVSTSFSGFSDKHFLQVVRSKRHISNSLSYIETEKNCHCKCALVSVTKHRSNDLSLWTVSHVFHIISHPSTTTFRYVILHPAKLPKKKRDDKKTFPLQSFSSAFLTHLRHLPLEVFQSPSWCTTQATILRNTDGKKKA